MNRNKQIDSLRGILSIMIMFFHFSYRFSQIYNISTIDFYTLKHWGRICVGCFFIITGFFLLPSELHDFSFIKFIRKKILRIYPSYFLCITIIFISVNIFGLEYRETRFFDYLLNVFMLNGFFGTPYVDGSHWYITYLLMFYILAGILLKISKITNKNYIYFCFMWLILKSLLKVGTKILPIPNFLYMLIGGNYLEFILIGITLRKISNHIKKGIYIDLSNKYLILNLILFFISILYVFVFRGILICFFVLVFILIFIYALNFKSYILSNPVLVFIGNISFIMYLIHQNIGYQLLLFFYNFGGFNLIYIIFVFTIIILISTFIYYFYEKKIQLK